MSTLQPADVSHGSRHRDVPPTVCRQWRPGQPGLDRAACLALLVLAITLSGITLFGRVISPGGLTAVDVVTVMLFGLLFGRLSCTFLLAVAGFVRDATGSRRRPSPRALASTRARTSRTAIVMPIRHEDVGRVHAGIRAMLESLSRTGSL